MEGKSLQVFKFDGEQRIRVVGVKGEPWIVVKDVLLGLEYSQETIKNLPKNLTHVPDEWKGRYPITTPGGIQSMTCLSEQGLYFFLARSDKPKALPFQKWIAGEVIPSIRKHGAYMTDDVLEDALADPRRVAKLLNALADERDKNKALRANVEDLAQSNKQLESSKHILELKTICDAPKVTFADAVETSTSSILIGDLAKLICQNGVDIGQNRLFEWMRDNGYLIKRGSSWNMPTQQSLEQGLFEVKERLVQKPDGSSLTKRTTKVTGKGQIYFINKFLKEVIESDD